MSDMGISAGTAYVDVLPRMSKFQAGVATGVAGSMRDVGRRMDGWGRNLRGTGRRLSTVMTLPVLAAGAAVVKYSRDFESAMNEAKAVTGATGRDFERLEGLALDLGRTTQFSASEAAEAIAFLGRAGFESDEILDSLGDTLSLAAAGGLDLGRAADIASNVLQGFGLEAEEMGRVADVLAQGAANSNTSVEQLGDALSFAAPIANAAGLEIEDTTAIIGGLSDAGIQGSRAGTTLVGMIAALEDTAGPAGEKLKEMGIRTHDANGELLPMADIIEQLGERGITAGEAIDIFGRRAGPGVAALVEQGADSLRDMEGTLHDADGAAQGMADTMMEGLPGAMARMRSAFEGMAIAIGKAGVVDMFAGMAERAADLFARVAEANPKLLRIGILIAGAAAVIGPALILFGLLVSGIGKLVGVLALVASPVGLVVGAIVGLGAVLVTAYRSSETFRDRVNSAFGRVREVVGEAVGWLGDRLGQVGEWFGITRQTVGDEVAAMSNEAVGEVVDMVQGMTDEVRVLAADGRRLSGELADEWLANIHKMRDQTVEAAEEQYVETSQSVSNLATDLDTISREMALDVIDNARDMRDESVQEAEDLAHRAQEQLERLRDSGVAVSDEMAEHFVNRMEEQRDGAVRALVDQEIDSVNVLSRLEAEAGKISVDMAATAIRNSAEQRDKTIAAANTEYEDRVAAINQMQRESDEFTQEMADNAIREARKMRDDTVDAANTQHSDVVGEVRGMRSGVEGEVDLMTGNVLSEWDRFYNAHLRGLNQWIRDSMGLFRGFSDRSFEWAQRVRDGLASALGTGWSWILRDAGRTVNAVIGVLNGMIGGVNRVARALIDRNIVDPIDKVTWGMRTRSPGRMHAGGLVSARSGETGGPDRLRRDEHVKILQGGRRAEEVLTADDPRHVFNVGSETDEIGGPLDAARRLARRARSAAADVWSNVRGLIADTVRPLIRRLKEQAAARAEAMGPVGEVVGGLSNRLADGALEWLSGVDAEAKDREIPDVTAGGGPGRWRAMWAAVKGQFPWARLTSAFRPGAITATGRRSLHGQGRAIDVAGSTRMNHPQMLQIARWIAANYNATELIYSRGPSRIRGRPWTPTGITRQNHFDHVHWGMANGAWVKPRPGGVQATVAEGRHAELVAPEPMLRQVVRDETGGGAAVPSFAPADLRRALEGMRLMVDLDDDGTGVARLVERGNRRLAARR